MSNEVRLTSSTFSLLCKLGVELYQEKERLRKIVVMQNDALERLTNKPITEEQWIKEYRRNFARLQAERLDKAIMKETKPSDADLDMRDKTGSEFWPPLSMIP